MLKHKHIDKICAVIIVLSLIITVAFMNGEKLGITAVANAMGYESRLFDATKVHTIDIVMDDWDSFVETCENEEYSVCNVIIDGEAYKNVGIRAKGNTSLSSVSALGSDRYSFKIEFDQYDDTKSYYGLDKLCLNNIIQDNSFMKDFLVYQLMEDFGVAAPLCSYVYITVNGEDWGLYLAVEGIEEAFLKRNYGNDYGELYKPDSLSFGGGRGNGKDFGMGSEDVKLQYIDDNYESYSNIFDSAKTDITDADKNRLIESLKYLSNYESIEEVVNIEAVLRYFVVHNFVVNGDSYTGSMIHNYYLYEEDGQLSMLPWDYNLAYGTFQGSDAMGTVNEPIDSPVSGGTGEDRPMVAWIFENEAYTEAYHEYFEEFIEKYFDSGYLASLIDSTAKLIAPYVEKDPTKFCEYEEFEAGVAAIKEFCLLRAESVSGQLAGTIPSTTEGQTADGTALIDASSLNLSDMGTMSGGMGGGMKMPDMTTTSFTGGEMPDMSGFTGGEMPDMSGFTDGEMPDMPDMSDMTGMFQGMGNMQGAEGMPGMPGDFGNSESTQAAAEANSDGTEGQQSEDTSGQQQWQQQRPSRDDMGLGTFPMGDNVGMSGAGAQTAVGEWILLGVTVLVLVAGLIFAFKFKR